MNTTTQPHSYASDHLPSMKMVLLGDSTVGKTSIVNIVQNGDFNADQSSTIGACFHIQKVKVNNRSLKVHIWDTAGQERFRSLAPMYYRDAQYAFIVYAVDSEESYVAAERWYEGLKNDCKIMPEVIILANKCDLINDRVVSLAQGRALAEKFDSSYYETSAKTGQTQIKEIFNKIAEEYITKLTDSMTARVIRPEYKEHATKERCGC